MSKIKYGKRNVELLGEGKVKVTLGGKERTFKSVKEFKRAERIFESGHERSVRKGKSILAKWRQ